MDEFSLINRWFNCSQLQPHAQHIVLGNGDDCAVINVPEGCLLAQSIDTHIAEKHFPKNAPAKLIAMRTLSASLSDLAATGAEPHSFSVAISLPEADQNWLQPFSEGLALLAQKYNITLIGGDTTCGPLCLSFHVQGFVPAKKILTRSGAKPGDRIFVSGTLGNGAGALPLVLSGKLWQPDVSDREQQEENCLLKAYYAPQPQFVLGRWLSDNGVRTAIDISDGLLADLGHILTSSQTGAILDMSKIPLSSSLLNIYGLQKAHDFALTGGDDYQLCFCWPKQKAFPEGCPVSVTEIGVITDQQGIIDTKGKRYAPQGFNHFSCPGL